MKKQLYIRLISLVALLSATLPVSANRIITKTEVYEFYDGLYEDYYDGYYSRNPDTGDNNNKWKGEGFGWDDYDSALKGYGSNWDAQNGNIYLRSESFSGNVKRVIINAGAYVNPAGASLSMSVNNNSQDITCISQDQYYNNWGIPYEDYSFEDPNGFGGIIEIRFNIGSTAQIFISSITVEYETEAPPEPYAVLSEGNTVLTFYYDNEKDTKEWMNIGPFDNGSDRGWYNQREDITKVVFNNSFANYTSLTSTFSWFDQCKNLATIDGINNLKTDNVENMRSMFEECSSLTSLDLSNFNTAKVTDFNFMFAGCSSLTSLNISSFDTESAVNMRFMFPSCSSLESLDLRSFNTANVTDMHGLFRDCSNLQTIYVSSSWTTASVTDSEDMFKDCSSLVGDAGTTYNASHTDAGYAHIDEGQTNPGYLSVINEPYAVLSEGKTVLTFYYDHLKKDRGGLSVGPFSSSGSSWVGTSGNNVTTATFDPSFANCTSITSTAYWFYHLYKLTAINGIEYLNTTNVTDMENMFGGCNSLTSLDVSTFNTGNVINMTYLFASCSSLTSLDVSKFDTRNVTNMAYMFSGCRSLTSLDVSHLDTKNVTSMQSMFNYCQSLTSINVDNFDTGKVTDFEFMFRQCNSLSDIYCDKSWVKDYIDSWAMFTACTNLRGYDSSHDYYAINYAKPYADGGYFTSTSRIGVDDSESETYAVLSDNNTTLTFYFDNQKQTRAGMSVDGLSSPESRGWHDVASSITTAVFDLSFAYCQTLTSTSYWFKGCTNLTKVKDIKFLITDNVTTMNDMFNGCSSLKDLDVTNIKTDNVTNMSGMFSGCSSLIRLDVSHFKTDNVTTMNGMFNSCSSLLSLDVTNFKTDIVTDMSSMFGNCSELRELDLGKFKTDNVTTMNSMFEGCSRLMTIYVCSEWGSSSALPTGNEMFKDCIVLVGGNGTTYDANHIDYTYAHIDGGTVNPGYFTDETATRPEAYAVLSEENTKLTFYYDTKKSDRNGMSIGPFISSGERGWNGNSNKITDIVFDATLDNYTKLTSTAYWFTGCSNLTTLTISNLRTYNVTSMSNMFNGCSNLTNLAIGSLNTSNVTNMNEMFENCSKLVSLDLSNFNTGNVTGMSSMFENCSGLTNLVLSSSFNTAKVTNMSNMFEDCISLTSLDASSFNTANVCNMSYMFTNCSSLASLDLSNFNTEKVTKMHYMFKNCSSLTSLDVSNFNTANITYMSLLFSDCSSLTALDVSSFNTANVTDMELMFAGCRALSSLDLSNFDTNKVTNMAEMFENCTSLASIDLSSFNTENVIRMDWMFEDCSSLTSLDVSGFNTSNVTDMSCMFGGCSGLTSLDLSSFNTSNVTSMTSIFSGCSNLTSIDLSSFNTEKVKCMGQMFYGCSHLTSLDLSSFNTSMVIYNQNKDKYGISSMFYNCSALTTIYVGEGWTIEYLTESADVFKGCTALVGGKGTAYDVNHTDYTYAHIDGSTDNPGYLSEKSPEPYAVLTDNDDEITTDESTVKGKTLTFYYDTKKENRGGMDVGPFIFPDRRAWHDLRNRITTVIFNTSFANYTSLSSTKYWFNECSNLKTITDINNLKTENVTDMSYMFYRCSGLTSLDISGFNTENVTNMCYMFTSCSGLTNLDVSRFKTGNVTDMGGFFYGCSGLKNLDVSGFNTGNVMDMNHMFADCSGLTSLDVSGFNTDNVRFMDGMFSGCSSLTSLDVSGFNTENVTDMKMMFGSCRDLISLDLSGFKTDNVTDMFGMFFDCWDLTNLDISGFKTDKVTNMGQMFLSCSSLTSLDVSSFNTANVTIMTAMFMRCSGLTSLDVSGFNTDNVRFMGSMFSGCSALTTIYVGDGWTTENLTEGGNVFNNCTALIGGQGTSYDANHTDYTYAHIDGGTSNPGYFTDKNKKNVTITAKSCSREYGEANPTFEYTVEGATLSGEPTITCEATATSPVGTYPIVITYTAEDASKMNLTYVDGALTITKAPLTITAKSYTIIQGEPIPTFEVEYTGFKNNDTDTVFTTKPTISTEAKSDTIPGNYDIVVSGAVAANYEMKYVNGTLTITDDVTVTAKSYSRVYGDANPTFEFTSEGATLSGTPTISCEATATSPVGTYDIVISKGSISNSTVTYVSGTLTITKAPLTITAKSCTIKQGKTLPEFELEYSGLKNKETDTVFTKKPTVSTVATSNSEPGTYDITVSGAEAKNYEMKYVKGTLTITERTETFDGIVLTVNEGGNMDDAFEIYGGKEEAAKTIAAIIWNASEKLTDKMLEGINNPNLLVYVSETSMAPESTKNVVIDGKAKSIELVDAEGNNNFFVPQEFTTENISYSRAFKQTTQDGISRGWEGIALPFNVQKFIHEEHGDISPFGDSNCDYHFWLRQPTDDGVINALSIEANKPYIISMPNSDEYEPEFNHPGLLKFTSTNVTVPVTKVESVWLGDSAQIVPTFQNIEASPDIYVLNVGDSIMDQTEGSIFISNYRSARPFEVYTFHEPRSNETNIFGSRIISLSSLFGGNGTTGVNDAMKTAEPNGESWYDMNGRRLQGKPARKGVYIMNGKKVVIN